ncbi:MAG TPA: LamG domain-containing protein [Vicinamibacterales bacterium]|nr:LamG domain-containing protein [Vicinamibacterales bacterium]
MPAGLRLAIVLCTSIVVVPTGAAHFQETTVVWTFDRIDQIGGHRTTIEGNPRVIDTPIGKAVEFDGQDDALFVDVHPLAGAETFTWEAIFRPDGGAEEQRWFHLQESNSDNRMLFEIRVLNGQWCLDSYLHGPPAQKALLNREALHPLRVWHHVASVYDGREFRNYVNGVQEGAAEVPFIAQAAGRTAIGVRINRVNYFKGAIHTARFTRHALAPADFLKISEP